MTAFKLSKIEAFLQSCGSITKLAKTKYPNIEVCPYYDNWLPSKNRGELCYVREIVMKLNDEPGWYAKTKVSEPAYIKNKSSFDKLSKTPIGVLLFDSNDVIRIGLNYSKKTVNETMYKSISKHLFLEKNNKLWHRHSTFLVNGELLQLLEVFFPGVLDKLCC